MEKRATVCLAALAAVLAAGCAHHGSSQIPVAQADEPYRIGPEDILDVAVWRDPDLSKTLAVRPDGFISLPIVGEVRADGKTPSELAAEIKKRLSPYVQQPNVTVIVREVNSSRVFVTGEVAHPGAFPLKGRVSLLQAIALAGGFSEFANTDGIMVIRPGKDGGKIPVRYDDLIARKDAQRDLYLRAGDTVVVP
jgi:polysaccharide export outer membrane protein